jgi:hypothetical protein
MSPSRLANRMKKNSVRMNGTYFSPWCPRLGMATSFRM